MPDTWETVDRSADNTYPEDFFEKTRGIRGVLEAFPAVRVRTGGPAGRSRQDPVAGAGPAPRRAARPRQTGATESAK